MHSGCGNRALGSTVEIGSLDVGRRRRIPRQRQHSGGLQLSWCGVVGKKSMNA